MAEPLDPLTVVCPACQAIPGIPCYDPRSQRILRDGPHYARTRKAKRDQGRVTRGYSKAFKARSGTGRQYLIDGIPATLWKDVKAKCKRTGVSVRAQILQQLAAWVAEP